jgi:hypothetical protein
MSDEANPSSHADAGRGLSEGLGPLVEAQMTEYMDGRHIKAGDARESLWEFAKLVQAAERERIRALVEAVRDATAAAQDADDCVIWNQGLQDAWLALMHGLAGPSVRAKLRA